MESCVDLLDAYCTDNARNNKLPDYFPGTACSLLTGINKTIGNGAAAAAAAAAV